MLQTAVNFNPEPRRTAGRWGRRRSFSVAKAEELTQISQLLETEAKARQVATLKQNDTVTEIFPEPEKGEAWQKAAGLGVSQTTVGSQRKDLETSGQLSKLDSSLGADGKTRPNCQTARSRRGWGWTTQRYRGTENNWKSRERCRNATPQQVRMAKSTPAQASLKQ